jgi:hypothetical protein
MEYRVTIAIAEIDEDVVTAIFDALLVSAPESGPVMGRARPEGPTDYVLGLEADDAPAASMAAVEAFGSAVAGCESARSADATIVALHAERVPDRELDKRPELQTA